MAQHLHQCTDLAAGAGPARMRRQTAVKQVLGALLQLGQWSQLPAQQQQQAGAHRGRQEGRAEHRISPAGGQRGQHTGAGPPAPDQPVGTGHIGHRNQGAGIVQRQAGGGRGPAVVPPQQHGVLQSGQGLDGVADACGQRVRQDAAGAVSDHHQLVSGRTAVGLGEGAGQIALPELQTARQQGHRPASHHHRIGQHHDRLDSDAAGDQGRHHALLAGHRGLEVGPVGQVGRGRAVALRVPKQPHLAIDASNEHAVKRTAHHRLGQQKSAQHLRLAELLKRQLRRRIGQHALGLFDPYAQQAGAAQRLVTLIDLAGQHGVAFHPRQQQRRAQADAQRQRQHTAQRQSKLDRAGSPYQCDRPADADHAATATRLDAAIGRTGALDGRVAGVMAAGMTGFDPSVSARRRPY